MEYGDEYCTAEECPYEDLPCIMCPYLKRYTGDD